MAEEDLERGTAAWESGAGPLRDDKYQDSTHLPTQHQGFPRGVSGDPTLKVKKRNP